MAYQKLNAYRALRVIPSDNADIPYLNTSATGTNTSATANKLVDSGATFQTNRVSVGDIVYNTTDGSAATVTAIDSQTVLSLNADIFAAGSKAYTVYQGGQNLGCVLYIGETGDIKVTMAGGDVVTFNNLPTGFFEPAQVIKVWSTGTTATLINALW